MKTFDDNDIKPGAWVFPKPDEGMGLEEVEPVGSVDHIDGERYIKLSKHGSSDGEHHWIPLDWVEKVDLKAIHLDKTLDEVRAGRFDSFPGEGATEDRVA